MRITINKSLTLLLLIAASMSQHAAAIPGGGGDNGRPAWIAQFYASSAFAKVGKPVTVQWQSYYSVGCSIWTNQTGSKVVGTSGSTTVTPNSASTMSVRLTCAGTNGQTTSQTRSFSVNRADHPELNSLTVSAASADAGTSVTLSWQSSFSDFCTLTGTNSATLPASGSQAFSVSQGTNTFNMTCKRNDGRASNSMIKTVIGTSPYPRINNFYISIPGGTQYYAVWFADADWCALDGFTVQATGSRAFSKVGYQVTHRLDCYKNGYSATSWTTYRPSPNGVIGDEPILLPSDAVQDELPIE